MIPGSWSIAIQLGSFVGILIAHIRGRYEASKAEVAIQEELGMLESALPALQALVAAEVEGWKLGSTPPAIEAWIADSFDRTRAPRLARGVAMAMRLVRTGSLDPEMIVATRAAHPSDEFAALRTAQRLTVAWALMACGAALVGGVQLLPVLTLVAAAFSFADLRRLEKALASQIRTLEEAIGDVVADHYLAPVQRALRDQDKRLAEELTKQVARLHEMMNEQCAQPAEMLRQEKEQVLTQLNRLSKESSQWTKSARRLAHTQDSLTKTIQGELSAFTAQLVTQVEQMVMAQHQESAANRQLLEEHVAASLANSIDSFSTATDDALLSMDRMISGTLAQLQEQLTEAYAQSATDALLPTIEAIEAAQLSTGQLAQATNLLTQDVERYTLATTQWVTGLQHVGPHFDRGVADVLDQYKEIATLWKNHTTEALAQWQDMFENTAQGVAGDLASRAAMTASTMAVSNDAPFPKRRPRDASTPTPPTAHRVQPPRALTIEEAEIRLKGEILVSIATTRGDIHLRLRGDLAPVTVTQFVHRATSGLYDGQDFHANPQVVRGGIGVLPVETTSQPPQRGAIATRQDMAHGFFILKTDTFDDGADYAVFGHVAKGMDVVEALGHGDKITQVVVG